MECHIWGIQSFIIFPNQNQQFNALLNQRRKDQSSHQLSGREAKLITDEPFDPPRNTTDESPLGNPSPLPVSKDSWLRFVILSAWNEPATHTKKKKKKSISRRISELWSVPNGCPQNSNALVSYGCSTELASAEGMIPFCCLKVY